MIGEKNILDEFKKNYERFREKYNLPTFQEINEDFEIEEIAQEETEVFSRKIRRKIMDKIVGNLKFIELFIKPCEPPLFLLKIIKNLTQKDKDILKKIYDKLGKYEIETLELEINYSEQSEADFIKKIFEEYQKIKLDMAKIINSLKKQGDSSFKNDEKSYFG